MEPAVQLPEQRYRPVVKILDALKSSLWLFNNVYRCFTLAALQPIKDIYAAIDRGIRIVIPTLPMRFDENDRAEMWRYGSRHGVETRHMEPFRNDNSYDSEDRHRNPSRYQHTRRRYSSRLHPYRRERTSRYDDYYDLTADSRLSLSDVEGEELIRDVSDVYFCGPSPVASSRNSMPSLRSNSTLLRSSESLASRSRNADLSTNTERCSRLLSSVQSRRQSATNSGSPSSNLLSTLQKGRVDTYTGTRTSSYPLFDEVSQPNTFSGQMTLASLPVINPLVTPRSTKIFTPTRLSTTVRTQTSGTQVAPSPKLTLSSVVGSAGNYLPFSKDVPRGVEVGGASEIGGSVMTSTGSSFLNSTTSDSVSAYDSVIEDNATTGNSRPPLSDNVTKLYSGRITDQRKPNTRDSEARGGKTGGKHNEARRANIETQPPPSYRTIDQPRSSEPRVDGNTVSPEARTSKDYSNMMYDYLVQKNKSGRYEQRKPRPREAGSSMLSSTLTGTTGATVSSDYSSDDSSDGSESDISSRDSSSAFRPQEGKNNNVKTNKVKTRITKPTPAEFANQARKRERREFETVESSRKRRKMSDSEYKIRVQNKFAGNDLGYTQSVDEQRHSGKINPDESSAKRIRSNQLHEYNASYEMHANRKLRATESQLKLGEDVRYLLNTPISNIKKRSSPAQADQSKPSFENVLAAEQNSSRMFADKATLFANHKDSRNVRIRSRNNSRNRTSSKVKKK